MPRPFTPAQQRKYEKQKAMIKRNASRSANERLREKRRARRQREAWIVMGAAVVGLGLVYLVQALHIWR